MLAVDVESYELDHEILLEIGVTLFNILGSVLRPMHFIIDEHTQFRNGRCDACKPHAPSIFHSKIPASS